MTTALNPNLLPMGTLVRATQQTGDLTMAFLALLATRRPARSARMMAEVPLAARECPSHNHGNLPESRDLLDEIIDVLEGLTPAYTYFGTNQVRSDYGVWPDFDKIREAIESGDIFSTTSANYMRSPTNTCDTVLVTGSSGDAALWQWRCQYSAKDFAWRKIWEVRRTGYYSYSVAGQSRLDGVGSD